MEFHRLLPRRTFNSEHSTKTWTDLRPSGNRWSSSQERLELVRLLSPERRETVVENYCYERKLEKDGINDGGMTGNRWSRGRCSAWHGARVPLVCCVTLAPGRSAAGPRNDSPRRRTLAEADPPIAQPRTRPRCLGDSS